MFGFSSRDTLTVDAATAAARLGRDGHVLVDVRTPEEVRAQGVPGSLNIPLVELAQKLDQLKAYQTIDVICRSGSRSGTAAQMLVGRGLPARSVAGGLLAWSAEGLPTKNG